MIGMSTPTEQCRSSGGHYWRAQVPGQPNVCVDCGYEGVIFEPALGEQQVRARALEMANDWATARGASTNEHPGTVLITKVARSFTDFIIDGTVVEQ